MEHLLHPPGDLCLGAAHELLPGEPLVRGVRDAGRPPDRVQFSFVLDRPQAGDDAGGRQQCGTVLGQGLVAGDGDVVGLERDWGFTQLAKPRSEPAQQVPLGLHQLDPIKLLGGLHIAAVRGQYEPVAADDEGCVRALEAREIADVDRLRDEETAGAESVERGLQATPAVGHPRSFRNASASWYPSGPLPMMRWVTTSAMTECRRHSSRSSMFERCTSTTGAEQSSNASRMA